MNYLFELKYTLRLLRKRQGFALLCTFVIAVGIGISIPLASVSEFFGFVNLPLANSDRLVILKQQIEGQGNVRYFDAYSYNYIKKSEQSYEFLSAFRENAAVFSDGETAESFAGAWIEPELLEFAASAPVAGRSLIASDNLPGAEPVGVIGFDLWQSYYASSDDVVGRISRINGENVTIVGIMPPEFGFPIANDLWMPLQLLNNPDPGLERNLNLVGLLSEGASQNEALVELDSMLQSLSIEYPEFYSGLSAIVLPYSFIIINDGPIFGQLFIGMLITVLLLVCFNVGNLLSARNSERLNELAVRGALGGTRWRIISQVLLESFLICVFAAALGAILGSIGLSIIDVGMASRLSSLPFWINFSLDGRDFFMLVIITTSVWLLSGFYPAWKISRQDINVLLSSDSKITSGAASGRLTKLLVTIEIVVSCFLLIVCLTTIAAGYFSFRQDMGVNATGLLSARINLSSANYVAANSKLNFLQDLRSELLETEGFEEVTYATAMAGQDPKRINFDLEDLNLAADSRYPQVGIAWVSANYFEMMETDSLQGRFFGFDDDADSGAVVIVDELFAHKYWPEETALGKRIQLQPEQGGQWLTIVGVVNHIIQGQPTAERLYESTIYRPIQQLVAASAGQTLMDSISFAVRVPNLANRSLADLEQSLKSAAANVDREVPVLEIMPMSQMMMLGMKAIQFFYDIMLWMALATVILASVGIYGVVSRSVLSRGMEIGIRRALGSTNLKIVSIFLKQGLAYLSSGLLIGGIGGVLVVNSVFQAVGSGSGNGESSIFFIIILMVVLMLSLMVFVASYMPTRKLVALEPGEALHYE